MEALLSRLQSSHPPSIADRDSDDYSLTRIDTDDADEHAAHLQHWNQKYDQLTAGRFAGTLDEIWFGNVQIFRERTSSVLSETGLAWDGSRTIGLPLSAEGNGWFSGETFDMGSIITLGSGDELDFRTPRQLDIIAVTADAADFNDYADRVWNHDLEAAIDGPQVISASLEKCDQLRKFLSMAMREITAAPAMLNHPQIRRGLEQEIYNALLKAVSHCCDDPRSGPTASSKRLLVDRARDFIRTRTDAPITVADLCRELGVSRRTLQYSFQDVLNVNPVAYLRAVRLNGARRDLKRASTGVGGAVADIAAQWGFWHLSHFSADYKLMFGELPSDTLKAYSRPAAK